jgi:hypothetical protein
LDTSFTVIPAADVNKNEARFIFSLWERKGTDENFSRFEVKIPNKETLKALENSRERKNLTTYRLFEDLGI